MGRQNKERRRAKKKAKQKKESMRRQRREQRRPPEALAELDSERRRYAEQWAKNDEDFTTAGHYEWMRGLIEPYESVLEIGTGLGGGTVVLARGGSVVVSIDENPRCLARAQQRLAAENIPVQLVERERATLSGEGYSIEYSVPDVSLIRPGVTLLQADVLKDPTLLEWLQALPPFDVVVCWLIGSHGARVHNASIDWSSITSPGIYRLAVQNTVYELADSLLRPGGILQVVDRGEVHDSAVLKADNRRAHEEQAEPTSLKVIGCGSSAAEKVIGFQAPGY